MIFRLTATKTPENTRFPPFPQLLVHLPLMSRSHVVLGTEIPLYNIHLLIHFACFQKHIGLYPGPEAVEEFLEQLSDYKTTVVNLSASPCATRAMSMRISNFLA